VTRDGEGTRALAGALLRGEGSVGPCLVVTDGPGAGRRLRLGARQTLGRGREADVRLEDPGASRLHARLVRDGGRYVATDLGSKNGLRVNGRRCRHPRTLRAGDQITIGATRLRFDEGEEAAPSPSAAEANPPPHPATARQGQATAPRARLLATAALLLALAGLLLAG